jgi:hypothetical protein
MQRYTTAELQARFAARLRTTPGHQRAARMLNTAIRAKVRADTAVNPDDPFWQRSSEFWARQITAAHQQITWADRWAELEADRIADE